MEGQKAAPRRGNQPKFEEFISTDKFRQFVCMICYQTWSERNNVLAHIESLHPEGVIDDHLYTASVTPKRMF